MMDFKEMINQINLQLLNKNLNYKEYQDLINLKKSLEFELFLTENTQVIL